MNCLDAFYKLKNMIDKLSYYRGSVKFYPFYDEEKTESKSKEEWNRLYDEQLEKINKFEDILKSIQIGGLDSFD